MKATSGGGGGVGRSHPRCDLGTQDLPQPTRDDESQDRREGDAVRPSFPERRRRKRLVHERVQSQRQSEDPGIPPLDGQKDCSTDDKHNEKCVGDHTEGVSPLPQADALDPQAEDHGQHVSEERAQSREVRGGRG